MACRPAASPSTPASPRARNSPSSAPSGCSKPDAAATTVVVEALLDSPSVTGAYKFSIKPGEDTQMDVELTLFPRRDIAHVGIAPMTSMFLLDPLTQAGRRLPARGP